MIPIIKYLELFDLFLDEIVFTCSYSLLKKCIEIFHFDNKKLVKKYNYKLYHEIVNDPPPILIALISQDDELNSKKSISNIIRIYRRNNKKKLILIVDKEKFTILNETKELKESLFFSPIWFDDVYDAVIKAFSFFNITFGLNDSGKNIGLQQIAFFLGYIEDKQYTNVRNLFLNISIQPYSPLWNYFSIRIAKSSSSEEENYRNNQITMNNIFKFMNIHYKLAIEDKKQFIEILQNSLKESLFDTQVRSNFIKKLTYNNEMINEYSSQLNVNLIRFLREERKYPNLFKNLLKFVKIISGGGDDNE